MLIRRGRVSRAAGTVKDHHMPQPGEDNAILRPSGGPVKMSTINFRKEVRRQLAPCSRLIQRQGLTFEEVKGASWQLGFTHV
jgi:hypothetical protein